MTRHRGRSTVANGTVANTAGETPSAVKPATWRPRSTISGADPIENETGVVTVSDGKNNFTNTGTLTVGGGVVGRMTLSDDLEANATGVITVASNGTLDHQRHDMINDGKYGNNTGQINVAAGGTIAGRNRARASSTTGHDSFTDTGAVAVSAGRQRAR